MPQKSHLLRLEREALPHNPRVASGSGIGNLLRRALVPALALVTAFALGAVVIVLTDFEDLGRLGTDPAAAIGAALGQVVAGYRALLAGAIGDPGRIVNALQSGQSADIAKAIRPLTEALLGSTPYILVGLGL